MKRLVLGGALAILVCVAHPRFRALGGRRLEAEARLRERAMQKQADIYEISQIETVVPRG